MDLESTVRAAVGGISTPSPSSPRRFQHMAFGYALSFVRDLGQAEDVVQEAFVAAWHALPTLADPAAFAGWLRGIVRHRAHRMLRRAHLESVPLTRADTVAADEPAADHRAERRQQVGALLAAIAELPRPLREVVTLYYCTTTARLLLPGHRDLPGGAGHDGQQPAARGPRAAQAEDADHGTGHARGPSSARRLCRAHRAHRPRTRVWSTPASIRGPCPNS